MNSAFLIFDLVGGNAGLELKCNARGCIHPELNDLEEAVGLIVREEIEKRGDQYQMIVQIGTRYRGSFNTLAFGEIKPYIGSLKDGRLDLVYYRTPG
jgi:hypothetical protein